jgi:hypothetical protein
LMNTPTPTPISQIMAHAITATAYAGPWPTDARDGDVSNARALAAWEMRRQGYQFQTIAFAIGRSNHATAISAISRVAHIRSHGKDPLWAEYFARMKALVEGLPLPALTWGQEAEGEVEWISPSTGYSGVGYTHVINGRLKVAGKERVLWRPLVHGGQAPPDVM